MRRWTTWLVLLASGLLAGCGGSKAPQLVTSEVLTEADLNYFWTLHLDLPDGESLLRLSLVDENLYVVTDRNYLYTLDAASGAVKWSYRLGSPAMKSYRVYHASDVVLPERRLTIQEIAEDRLGPSAEPVDVVLVNTLTKLHVFDRSNGQVLREVKFDFTANTGPACDGRSAFIGSSEELVYSVRLASATHLWSEPSGSLAGAPEYTEGFLFVANEQGRLHCIKPGFHAARQWTKELSGKVAGGFHADQRGLFLGTDENFLYGLVPESGETLWEPFITQGPINRPVQVGANSVFAYADGDRFYAVNLTTGQQRWAHPAGRRVLAAIRGTIYLLDRDRNLHLVDEVLGTDRTTLPLVGMDLFADNAVAPAIYTATRDGRVFCIRPDEAGQLTPDMLYRTAR